MLRQYLFIKIAEVFSTENRKCFFSRTSLSDLFTNNFAVVQFNILKKICTEVVWVFLFDPSFVCSCFMEDIFNAAPGVDTIFKKG